MKILRLGILILAIAGSQLFAGWQQTVISHLPYVTMDSFCQFYGLKVDEVESTKNIIILRKEKVVIHFNKDSREAVLNGVKIWLCYPFIVEENKYYVSKEDVIKTFDPVLRPDQIERRKVRGVVIDAGHGGNDNGAVSRSGVMEKTLTLDTARRLYNILQDHGIPVVTTRSRDTFIPLEDRAAYGKKYPDYLFISIHFNMSYDRDSRGVETYCLSPVYVPSTSSEGRRSRGDSEKQLGNNVDPYNTYLAYCVHQEVKELHPHSSDRGIKRARFVVLRENTIPAILVEGGFVSNRADLEMLTDQKFRQSLAEKMANGIIHFMRAVNPEEPKKEVLLHEVKTTVVLRPDEGNLAKSESKPEVKTAVKSKEEKSYVKKSTSISKVKSKPVQERVTAVVAEDMTPSVSQKRKIIPIDTEANIQKNSEASKKLSTPMVNVMEANDRQSSAPTDISKLSDEADQPEVPSPTPTAHSKPSSNDADATPSPSIDPAPTISIETQ